MALHDTYVRRLLAFGISGLSVMADSLSAIKHAKVTPIRDERGLVTDFKVEGAFPKYGNDNDEVDAIATWCVNGLRDSQVSCLCPAVEAMLMLLWLKARRCSCRM
jgi:pyruvate-formate lyase